MIWAKVERNPFQRCYFFPAFKQTLTQNNVFWLNRSHSKKLKSTVLLKTCGLLLKTRSFFFHPSFPDLKNVNLTFFFFFFFVSPFHCYHSQLQFLGIWLDKMGCSSPRWSFTNHQHVRKRCNWCFCSIPSRLDLQQTQSISCGRYHWQTRTLWNSQGLSPDSSRAIKTR